MNRRSFISNLLVGALALPLFSKKEEVLERVSTGHVAYKVAYLQSLGWTWWAHCLWRPSAMFPDRVVKEGPFASCVQDGEWAVLLPKDSLCVPSGLQEHLKNYRLNPKWLEAASA